MTGAHEGLASKDGRTGWGGLAVALVLFALTFASVLYAGCALVGVDPFAQGLRSLWQGSSFAVPLMAILLSHELGHYFVARAHHVQVSLPLFIPMPFGLIGTFGAVIGMRTPVSGRTALLDIGAAGPLAGLAVTLPILVYGLHISPVQAVDPAQHVLMEGHSLLYSGLIYLLKGPIPEGHDVFLSPPAFAGWAGLLVTMMNLLPVGQLDGGHVAYALFGPRQHAYSQRVLRGVCGFALLLGGVTAFQAFRAGASTGELMQAAASGSHWLMWWLVLRLMERASGAHPATAPGELSRARRVLAWCTLALFGLLFMPTWLRAT